MCLQYLMRRCVSEEEIPRLGKVRLELNKDALRDALKVKTMKDFIKWFDKYE